jgi:hypothetical protein
MQQFPECVRWQGNIPVGQLEFPVNEATNHLFWVNHPDGTYSRYRLATAAEALAEYERAEYTGPILLDWPTVSEGWLAVAFLPYGANSRFVGWLSWSGSIDDFYKSINN